MSKLRCENLNPCPPNGKRVAPFFGSEGVWVFAYEFRRKNSLEAKDLDGWKRRYDGAQLLRMGGTPKFAHYCIATKPGDRPMRSAGGAVS